jgi:hypothetical protein
MTDTSANPLFVALLFILRCVVPLAILFGISYLLRKMGLVAVEAPEPSDKNGGEVGGTTSQIETSIDDLETPEVNRNNTKTVENKKES